MKNERSDWQLKYTNALVSLACLLLCFSSSSDLIAQAEIRPNECSHSDCHDVTAIATMEGRAN
jgi:hypothetical protein